MDQQHTEASEGAEERAQRTEARPAPGVGAPGVGSPERGENGPPTDQLRITAVQAAVAAGLTAPEAEPSSVEEDVVALPDPVEPPLPAWTDPPTGQVPRVLLDPADDLDEDRPVAPRGPSWREEASDWDDDLSLAFLVEEGEEQTDTALMAGRGPELNAEDPFDLTFADLDVPVHRTGVSAVPPVGPPAPPTVAAPAPQPVGPLVGDASPPPPSPAPDDVDVSGEEAAWAALLGDEAPPLDEEPRLGRRRAAGGLFRSRPARHRRSTVRKAAEAQDSRASIVAPFAEDSGPVFGPDPDDTISFQTAAFQASALQAEALEPTAVIAPKPAPGSGANGTGRPSRTVPGRGAPARGSARPLDRPAPRGAAAATSAGVASSAGERPASGGAPRRNARVATITGLGAGAVAILCFLAGPVAAVVLVAVALVVAAGEGYATMRSAGRRPATFLGLAAVPLAVVGTYLWGPIAVPAVFAGLVVLGFVWSMALGERASPVSDLGATVLVAVWVGALGSFAGLLLSPARFPDRHGVAFLVGVVAVTVAHDVGCYAVGARLGRHLLAPRVSPSKTWEGIAGGTVLAFLVAGLVLVHIHPFDLSVALLLAVIVCVLAPLGDLAESVVKRDLKVKDMGRLLPAHGGVFDRVDAMLFVLPAAYGLFALANLR
ncbi:MAG: phosphatidate cytidylyltransferase [Acidimicrobiaceae bacterium]|nr:phosphatidate cytidylyltransferase [Acidimicrobiaceae bacterium]